MIKCEIKIPNTKDLGLLRLGWMLRGRDVSVIGRFLLAAPSHASSCSAPESCMVDVPWKGWAPTFLPQSAQG